MNVRAPGFPCNRKTKSQEKDWQKKKGKNRKANPKQYSRECMQPPNADLAHETKIPKCARYPSSFKHAGHYLDITLEWA